MPTDRERIEQWSLGYYLLKAYTVFCYKIYFRTTIVGLKQVPFEKSLIFAANHQNSLNDAHCIHCINFRQTVFLARSDIFKKSTINKILTYFKILPVYRIRDGYSNLQLNDDVFRKTLDVLRNRNGIGIFPEGNHFGQRRLRPLKKGIARIAFQAEDATNNELKIQIIPVGLTYSNYINLRSKLLIRLGQPIDVSKHLDLYRQNPAQAYNALIEDIEAGLKTEMIQIDDEAFYDEYEMLREVFTPSYIKANRLSKNFNNQFEIDKRMIASVDKLKVDNQPRFMELMDEVKSFSNLIITNELTLKSAKAGKLKLWSLVLQLPLLLATSALFVYGFINNIITISASYLLSNKIKDEQFISSIRFAVGMLIFPIAVIVQAIIFLAISRNGLFTLYYIASIPVSAIIAYNWRRYFISALQYLKVARLHISKPDLIAQIKTLNGLIYNKVKEVM
jgi:1-acyl-sn-glycerol-3-phosphate acyltransferase